MEIKYAHFMIACLALTFPLSSSRGGVGGSAEKVIETQGPVFLVKVKLRVIYTTEKSGF